MGSNFTGLTVTWLDESDGYSTTANVTTDLLAIPIFTDTGSGEVNEAEIVLSAKGGKYITTGNQVDKYDRFRIQITDLSSNSYDRYFEVIDIIPSQSKTEGSVLTLSCAGIEYHTQVIHYARRDWFQSAFDVAQHIGDSYESNNGARQPLIDRHDEVYSTTNGYGNGLPKWTNNHYEFGQAEDSCYNRWMQLITLLGGSVANGGVGDFFELGFDTSGANLIDMALFVSGARTFDGNDPANDSSAETIENTTSINVSEQEGGISNPAGTKVAAWGSPIHGSLPVDFSEYAGNELEFIFRPAWIDGVDYKAGAKVRGTDKKHYRVKAGQDHTSDSTTKPVTGANYTDKWEVFDMGDEFGDTVQYSPWTDDKAVLWANAGADPDAVSSISAWATSTEYTIGDLVTNGGNTYVAITKHTSDSSNINTDITAGNIEQVDNALLGNGAGFFDCNISVRDDGIMFRTWVHEVVGDSGVNGGTAYDGINDATLDSNYLHDSLSDIHNPEGHRILNIGTTNLGGSSDLKGRSFEDAVIKRVKSNGASPDVGVWEVLYEKPNTYSDINLDKAQVFDIKDRKIW